MAGLVLHPRDGRALNRVVIGLENSEAIDFQGGSSPTCADPVTACLWDARVEVGELGRCKTMRDSFGQPLSCGMVRITSPAATAGAVFNEVHSRGAAGEGYDVESLG